MFIWAGARWGAASAHAVVCEGQADFTFTGSHLHRVIHRASVQDSRLPSQHACTCMRTHAGKTTLLDVLGGRRCGEGVRGEVGPL